MSERTVGVVGLGLIGGSLARALVARGVRVFGTAHDARDAQLAAGHGVTVLDDVERLAAAVPAEGTVVLAVPLAALAAVGRVLVRRLAPPAVVLHAAGLQRASATGLDDGASARVIGTHPLAGSHETGFAASRADLFAGATVWAEARADAAARARLEWLWGEAGAGTVKYEPAEAHDATMAWVSHLPQLASVALAGAAAAAGMPAAFGGPGLGGATRLAASPFPLWRDILGAAPPETDAALAGLAAAVDQLRAALARGDVSALEALWARARAWRCASSTPDHQSSEETAVTDARTALAAGGVRW